MAGNAQAFVNDYREYDVLDKVTLNFFDVTKNSNKFYTLELQKLKDDNSFRLFADYGRLGRSKKEIRLCSGENDAKNEFAKIKREKERKGYTKVDLAQSATGSNKAKELIDTSKLKISVADIKQTSQLPLQIQTFVKQIFDESNQKLNMLIRGEAINGDGTNPLGKLSELQIDKGQYILQELAELLAKNNNELSIDKTLQLSTEYYKVIPKVFGNRVTPEMVAINTQDKLSTQAEILNFYRDSLRMGSALDLSTDIDKKYESLKSEIGILNPTNKKYQEIVDYVTNSESKYHSVHLKVKNIFTVIQKNAPKFDTAPGNIVELFHGTRSANMPGILSSNLRLPNKLKGIHITGAMFGPGIYFANQSTKSSQYACARFGGSKNSYNTAFMFLCDVALGKVHKVYEKHYFYEPPIGFDSVQGCKKTSTNGRLLHDEFIVYHENRHEIKYIVEFGVIDK